jgi:hypothetical protein
VPGESMTARTAVHRWGEVPRALLDRWSAWPGARFVHQTADYAAAAAAGADPVYVAEHRGLISSFAAGRGRAVCLFTGRPTTGEPAGDDLVDLARAVQRALDVALVYFPYLDAAVARAAEACGFVVWERTASPFIDWSDRGAGLAARVRERYGSRAERQWRRFAGARLTTVAVTGTAAVEVMDKVESASWKASAGQSMHEREDQFALYSGLIERGAASTSPGRTARPPGSCAASAPPSTPRPAPGTKPATASGAATCRRRRDRHDAHRRSRRSRRSGRSPRRALRPCHSGIDGRRRGGT